MIHITQYQRDFLKLFTAKTQITSVVEKKKLNQLHH